MTALARREAVTEIQLTGRAASPGLAIGPVTVLTASVAKRTASEDPAQEAAALRTAIEGARAEIAEQIKAVQGEVADILEFQVAMLEDDALADAAFEVISVGITADHAWRLALDTEIEGYRNAEDEYFRARAADLVDIRDRVLAHLSGVDTVARIAGGAIVAADDITPSAFLAADWSRGGAIALAGGSPSSHVAMLARARGAPMVVGLGPLPWNGHPPTLALVDGDSGIVIFDPEPETRRLFEQRMEAANRAQAAAEIGLHRRRPTHCGSAQRHRARRPCEPRSRDMRWHRPRAHRISIRGVARAAG
jgi:phosphotransferase system enzyme I (PtsI)